ncbi:MAG TPA: PEGA domain-containing protein, partial [Myxococcales bacterium]|nr:PEGA domain-containing protein [Myxococcales bacterium]
MFLSINQNGHIGVQQAQAWAPPPIQKDKNLPAVYVVPFQRVGDYVSGSAVSRVDEYFRTLVDMNSDIQLRRSAIKKAAPEKLQVTKKPLRQDRDLEAADKAVWKGKEALRKRLWARAAGNFTRAAKLYERKLAVLEDFDKLVDAQLFIALSRFAQGYEADAEEALARVVTLRPELIVDKRWRSPEFESAIKRLKSGLARVPTGTLNISCSVAGCTIYVDGIVKGVNTASVTGYPRGNHVIRVTAVGYKSWAKRVFTPGKGQSRQVTSRLVKERVRRKAARKRKAGNPTHITPGLLADYVSEGRFNARFRMAAMRFCAQAGVDYLVMGAINRVGTQYVVGSYVYSVTKQQVIDAGQTLFEMDLSDLQVKLLGFEEQVSAAIKVFPRNKRVRRKPALYAKWTPPPLPKAKVKAAPKPVSLPSVAKQKSAVVVA